MDHEKLIILGSGPAGYTAAIYAARANLNPLLITGRDAGGQLMTTTEVENWPGGLIDLTGPKLMSDLEDHAKRLPVTMKRDHIIKVNTNTRPFVLEADNGKYTADAIIISTGASAKYLGLPSESKFKGMGVSACATCDGFFYKNKEVIVVGGGNTAVEETIYLSRIVKKVYLVHRRDQLRAEKMLVDRLMTLSEKESKIEVIWSHELDEVIGDDSGVTGVKLKSANEQKSTSLAVDGVFIAIGHHPNTDIFHDLSKDSGGYLLTEAGTTRTNIPGVFAAGDVMDSVYRQAITSAGTGCMAALDAEKYLAEFE